MEWNVYQHYKCKQMWKCMKNKKKKENCLMCGLFAVANYKLNIRWIKLNVNEKAKKRSLIIKRMAMIGSSWPMFIRRIRTSWISIMRNFFQLQIETFLMFLAIKPTLFDFYRFVGNENGNEISNSNQFFSIQLPRIEFCSTFKCN